MPRAAALVSHAPTPRAVAVSCSALGNEADNLTQGNSKAPIRP